MCIIMVIKSLQVQDHLDTSIRMKVGSPQQR